MLTGQVQSQGWSENIINFVAVLSGTHNNSAQIQAGTKNLDSIDVLIIPTNLTALDGKHVLYIEQSINNKVHRMLVCELTEGDDGVIYMLQINFTDTSKYTPRSFKVEDLSKVKREELKTDEKCKAAFKLVDPAVYFGNFQDCPHSLEGEHLPYSVAVTCSGVSYNAPYAAFEKRDLVPYDLKRQEESYPLVGAPEGYIGPCD